MVKIFCRIMNRKKSFLISCQKNVMMLILNIENQVLIVAKDDINKWEI